MLSELLGENKDQLVQTLASKIGLSTGEADGFLAQALAMLQNMLAGGKLDLASLLAGASGESLASGLDLSALTGMLGGDADRARTGLGTIIESLTAKLQQADDPQTLLGGLLGSLDSDGDGLDAGDIIGGLGKLF